MDSLLVGDTKPRFRKDAGIEREDWSAPNISLLQPCALSRSGEAFGELVLWLSCMGQRGGPIAAPEGREKRARLGLTITAWFANHGTDEEIY
jgi:hypothetical protein